MKQILLVMMVFLTLTCEGQDKEQEKFLLAVSPVIDKAKKTNQLIISTLTEFLTTKNLSLTENKTWLQSDFQRYIYPYLDIYSIEDSRYGKGFYRPTLMEIIPTDTPAQKIVKLSFIGYHKETGENQLKSIYNLIANVSQGEVKFSRYLDYATQNWQTVSKGSLTYKVSPNKKVNKSEINKQQKDIERVCAFFSCNPISITYYSCTSPKEIFEIKGFDYNTMMYVSKTGGLADFGNIIFSGNRSEVYTHEIVHVYTNNLFSEVDTFIGEGLATYIAGSGNFSYEWHRKKLDKFLTEATDYNFADHTDPYERLYFEDETSIPYLTSALILERVMRLYGREKLIGLLKSESGFWEKLSTVGLTRENVNEELRKEIKQPLTPVWQ